MTRTVVLTPAAQLEFLEAANWYDLRQPGVGAQFIAETEALLDQVARGPMRFPKVRQDARRDFLPGVVGR